MPKQPLRESDMRSLERRRMYTIFRPLDAEEPLPREKLVEGRRHAMGEVRRLEVAAALYLPALFLAIYVMGSAGVSPLVAFGIAGLMFLGFFVWVVSGKYR
ncbi:MAG TPA: hypothetical protein VNG70_07775 [Candidatus Limnocylindria bacterium]|jgi:Flp pilus assembly protein TadB|nr:hypothetical protein [Candidatus Limnocylindria bacterium]